MKLRIHLFFSIAVIFFQPACNVNNAGKSTLVFESDWAEQPDRVFVGNNYWANRLQDWRIKNGRLECADGRLQLRTLQLLTTFLTEEEDDFSMEVNSGIITDNSKPEENAFCGFLIGCGGTLDYRARAIIHYGSGKNGGLIAGINKQGELCFWDNEDSLSVLMRSGKTDSNIVAYKLQLNGEFLEDSYRLKLILLDEEGNTLQECILENINPQRLKGGIALVANNGAAAGRESYWFNDLKLFGKKIKRDDSQGFGPVAGVQYTLNQNVLKFSVQFFPVAKNDLKNVELEIKENGSDNIKYRLATPIEDTSFVALFRIENWVSENDYEYTVKYKMAGKKNNSTEYTYKGKINHEPFEKKELVIATLNCNNNCYRTFSTIYDFDSANLWFPHNDLVSNVKAQQPDMLLNLGDQLYETRPTDADKSGEFSSYLDYLYKWYLWYWAYGGLTREMPSVCLVDDHDVFQGNLWGAGGIKAREYLKDEKEYPDHYKKMCLDCWNADGGGYTMPAGFVRMVERTQTAHLPDPYDTLTLPYGIKSYYTSMKYAGVSFALLEDRKFKSSPSVMLPDAKVVNGFSQLEKYNARNFNIKDAQLLGQKQEEFIESWIRDWDDVSVKIAVSQSIFANVATMPSSYRTDDSIQFIGVFREDSLVGGFDFAKDMDSHGWPQYARNSAIEKLRKGFAFHVGGDQHIGVLLQQGTGIWRDGIYSFCVPPIANAWPRRWFPPHEGKNREAGSPYYTGDYEDGFGNKITVKAAANPYITSHHPAMLYDLVAGYGILKINVDKQQITIQCRPRYSSIEQFRGWPVIINIEDNYISDAPYSIATLKNKEGKGVFVEVYDKTEKLVYNIKTSRNSFSCNVFDKGNYKLVITDSGGKKIVRENLKALVKGEEQLIEL